MLCDFKKEGGFLAQVNDFSSIKTLVTITDHMLQRYMYFLT